MGAPIFQKNINIAPLCAFEEVEAWQVNACLSAWGHQMGPIKRGNGYGKYHALFHEGSPVAVTATSTLIAARVGGGLGLLTRKNTVELSRLCAERPGLCRVALRLWREFVFPFLGFEHAISYQDADLHNGNTYRFDGWKRIGYSHSGKDTRSGKDGRDKWIWGWNVPEAMIAEMNTAASPKKNKEPDRRQESRIDRQADLFQEVAATVARVSI